VAHFSIHSFTPVLRGVVRTTDVGVLYDPRRAVEKRGALFLQGKLAARLPDLRIRRNYPYTGYSDGHTTALRKRFPESRYAGFEIEVSQKFFLDDMKTWLRIRDALEQVIAEYCRAWLTSRPAPG
jgi:predicted N-formylglutamate amidohydrolase